MEKNNAKINDIISAMAERLEHNEKNICRVELDELSNDEIEALLNVKHDRFEFDIEYGLYIEMTEKEAWTAYKKAEAEHGLTEWEGEEYALLQDPYLDGPDEDLHYSGTAMDKKGNIYQVRWEKTEEYDESCERWRKEYEETGEPPSFDDDESMACDWWNPTTIELIDTLDESMVCDWRNPTTIELIDTLDESMVCDWRSL